MVYTHPWEFDPDPPRVPLPLTRRFLHDFLVRTTPAKIAGLLQEFRFGPMGEVLAALGHRTARAPAPVSA
jgi:hypothetical protein